LFNILSKITICLNQSQFYLTITKILRIRAMNIWISLCFYRRICYN